MNRISHVDVRFNHFDLIPNGVFVMDKDFQVHFWNACMAEWTGIPAKEMEGTNILTRYPTLNEPSVMERIRQLFDGGPTVVFSPTFHPHLIPCRLPGGNLMVHKISLIPMYIENTIFALVLVEDVSDLTNQVKAYRDMKKIVDQQLSELQKAQNAIYQANKKLNLLNSITRHDIMNKLTILIGYLELTRDMEGVNAELSEYVKKELDAANAIREQIQFTKFYQDVGVNNAVWQDAGESIRSGINPLINQGISIAVDVPRAEIFADPLLQKVFYNLVENSIRHGEKCTSAKFSAKKSGKDLVLVYEDDGVGVPVDRKEKIFKREYFKNTGYGLFLSREILAITHISIDETGIPGTGARFEITIPESAYRCL